MNKTNLSFHLLLKDPVTKKNASFLNKSMRGSIHYKSFIQ